MSKDKGENNWLTITELADAMKIADSTIRRYLHTFEVFFKHDGNIRGRRYEKNAIKVLNRIRELYEKGYDNRKVHSFLEEEFTVILDSENSNENSHEDGEKSPYIVISREDVDKILQGITELKIENKESNQRNEAFAKTVLEIFQRQEQTIQNQGKIIQQLVEELEQQRLSIATINEVAATTIESKISETEPVEATKEEQKLKKKGFFKRLFGQ